jgi:hypothetical protein
VAKLHNEIGVQFGSQLAKGFIQLATKPNNPGLRIPPEELKVMAKSANHSCDGFVLFKGEWLVAHGLIPFFRRALFSGRHGMRPGTNSQNRLATWLSFLM